MKLRDYQIKALDLVDKCFIDNDNAMLCVPTGGGKTVIFCEIAKNFHQEYIKKVLIVVHRVELLEQAGKSLGGKCFKIVAGTKNIPNTFDYYVAMVETLNNRISLLPEDLGLVIIDEAHIGNFNKLPFFDIPNLKVLGVSATPKSSNEIKLADRYKNIIIPTSISHLIKNNYLVDAECWGFENEEVEEEAKKWKVQSGEYQTGAMSDFYSSQKRVQTCIDSYWKKCAGKKTIIFNVNVEHNNAVHSAFKREGLNAYYIDSTITDKNIREEIVNNFINDPVGIMCNVGVLTTGFDCPSIEAVILNRATKSLVLYLQMIGRGSRIYKNKDKFILVDLGGNVERHGFYSEYRDWEKYFKECDKSDGDGYGEAPVKTCPKCGCIVHARVMECPGCGHIFVSEDKTEERSANGLVRLYNDDPFKLDLNRLFAIGKERNWKNYAYFHNLAGHLVNYQKKHFDLIGMQEMLDVGEYYFTQCCKNIGAKRTQWNRNYFKMAIETKQIEAGIIKEDDRSIILNNGAFVERKNINNERK